MTIKKVIEPGSVHKDGNNDKVEGGRKRIPPIPFFIRMRAVFICLLILLAAGTGVVSATGVWSSGWESEKALVRIGDNDKWSIKYYAFPHMAYNLRGDGKWVLISNRQMNGAYFGYYYNSTTNKWIEDSSLVSGLTSHCWQEYPAFAHNVTGDGKWTLISHCSDAFYGYSWNGTKWIEDSSRVNGLLDDIGLKTSHTFIENLTGDGNWTLLTGTADGTFRAFYWNGTGWIEDSSRVYGLPDIGGYSRVTAGYNVFAENKWNLITTTRSSKSFRVFCWNGTQWNEDTTKAAGLTTSFAYLVPTLGYNVTGDGKWVLISGVGQTYTLLGFFYNSVDTSSLPPQSDITSYHPMATTVCIKFSYPYTWNHRIRYSTNADMSDALWSEWFEDMDEVDVKLTRLNPSTTYYYEVYTYIPWDTSYYVKSSVNSFTTLSASSYIVVNPGESIQDAIETLPLAGGTVELATGTHNVRDTIVIYMSNITIQGTHSSEIRSHNPKDVFVIPHENPGSSEPWGTMSKVENLVFKGFKVTGTLGGGSVVHAWNVKNISVENILDEALGDFIAVNPTSVSTSAHSEDIFIRNNNLLHSSTLFGFSENIHILNNTLEGPSANIAIFRNTKYLYVIGNKVNNHGGSYACLVTEAHYSEIYDNVFEGNKWGIRLTVSLSNVIVRNNTVTGATEAGILLRYQFVMRNITIANNRVYNTKGHGILNIEHPSPMGYGEASITNNVIYSNAGDGIRMESEYVTLNISNNIITNNTGYGINHIAGNISHSYNNIWSNTLGSYNNTTAGTGDISADSLFADVANNDFHLKSTGGHWNGSTWVHDDVTSPCIDVGDPASDYSNEPAPNGGRINMGAYGNTVEASKSPPPTITSFYPSSSPVSDVKGKTRTFNITVDQVVNVTWMINGTQVQPINESVAEASYTNVSAEVGTWNVSAIATSVTTGLSAMQTWIWIVRPAEFDTGPGTYPSIFGTHRGKITPNHDVYVSKMYTYPCAGTGGHSEYVKFYNDSWEIEANWSGYQSGDYHYITFDEQFTLEAGITYNYTIKTGSYPQIHHNTTLTVPDGEITCTKFTDANGRVYYDWIPAFRLFL